MFLRRLTLRKKGRQYCYLKVVENTWQCGRTLQRSLVNLGNVEGWPNEKLEELVGVLTGFLEMDVVALGSVRFGECRVLGPYLALSQLWDRLGMDKILAGAFAQRRLDARAVQCAKAMVASRLVQPRSKKGVWESVSRDIEIPGVDGHRLPLSSYYRTLEYLSREKTRIEKAIHGRLVHLFNQDVTLVFYDLTSAYFEGRCCAMARHGYSREHRPDLVQIELGLMVDAEGLPVGHQVFNGNVKDVTTVLGAVSRLRDEFGVKRCVFVGDDGMASEANLAQVARSGYEYITSLSLGKSKLGQSLLQDAHAVSNWTKLADNFRIEPLAKMEDVRYIATYNPDRAAGSREHRKARLRSSIAFLRKLAAGPKPHARKKSLDETFAAADRFVVRRGCQDMIRLERREDGLFWTLDRDALRKASRMDGMLVLATNSTTLTDAEVARGYRTLWRVEDAFRHIKDQIGLRPIRHWNDSRVLGHVFVCVLAYTLERLYERELARAGLDVTARTALDELESIIVATLAAGERQLRRRSEITARQRELLAAAGVTEVAELW